MLSAPTLLEPHHELAGFTCGEDSLDDWLRRKALKNQDSGASRVYVLCEGARVMGYYALSSGAVATADAPGRFRRNMPDPIPVVVLGRLAVDRSLRGQGVGRALFQDAAKRVLRAAQDVGIRGLLVHALSFEAKAFYSGLGLSESPLSPMTMMVTLADLSAATRP